MMPPCLRFHQVALQVQLTWDDDDPKRSVLKGDKYDASS
jgi:hypothetical protein